MPDRAGPEAAFVLTLGRALHAYGTPSHRLEDTLNRVCAQLGLEGQFFTQPTSIFAAFGPQDRQHTFMLRVEPGGGQLDRLSQGQDVGAAGLSGAVRPRPARQ